MIRKYNHLLCRVEYPMENGYRMEPEQLPDWIYITITENNDNKYLTVHSRIHVNKEVKVGPNYSSEFSDRDIVKEQTGEISSRFLN